MLTRKKGNDFFALVTLFISLLALDQSQAAVEKYTKGVIKDGIVFVSARFVSRAFGADLRWAGDVRSLLLTYRQSIVRLSFETDISGFNMFSQIKPTIDLPAISVDGEVYVPLVEICEALDATIDFDAVNKNVVLIRDDIKMIVDLSSERTISPREKGNKKEQIYSIA